MFSCCLKCRTNTETKNQKVVKTKNGRIMHSSNFTVCGSKKLRFVEGKEASELLDSLGIRTSLSQIPLLGPLLF